MEKHNPLNMRVRKESDLCRIDLTTFIRDEEMKDSIKHCGLPQCESITTHYNATWWCLLFRRYQRRYFQ